jgi:membrane protein YdbS with pleckstrin-like domain
MHLRVRPGLIRIDAGGRRRQPEDVSTSTSTEWKPITMLAIIALVLIALVALAVLGFAVHILFSPWLLLAAVGILAWLKFGPRRARR